MSDLDFEIIESSAVVVSRSRKPKYSTRVWDYSDAKGEARYLLALARLHDRRGSDSADELRSKVNSRLAYEIELESVLPIFVDDDCQRSVYLECSDLSDDDVFVVDDALNSIVDFVVRDRFRVLSPFVFDAVKCRVVCTVPAGVVYKKMDLQDVRDVVFDYVLNAPSGEGVRKRLDVLFDWLSVADRCLEQLSVYGS
jgi:hypothetical protein